MIFNPPALQRQGILCLPFLPASQPELMCIISAAILNPRESAYYYPATLQTAHLPSGSS